MGCKVRLRWIAVVDTDVYEFVETSSLSGASHDGHVAEDAPVIL